MAILSFVICAILYALTNANLVKEPSNQELMKIIADLMQANEKLTERIAKLETECNTQLENVNLKLTQRIAKLETERMTELENTNEKLTQRIMNLETECNTGLRQVNEKIAKLEQKCNSNSFKTDFKTHKQSSSDREKGMSVESNVQGDDRNVRSDDVNTLELVVSQMSSQATHMEAEIQALRNSVALATGTSYVRWGNRECPGDAQLVYSGDVGGGSYDYTGSAVDYLCLPKNPIFDDHPIPNLLPLTSAQQLYGTEYESFEINRDLNAVCAVCRTSRSSTIMVPATKSCPAGWNMEYEGYLMAGSVTHPAATEFVCVDHSELYEPGTNQNNNGKLLYYTVTQCGSLACPPYVNNQIVLCVVCSK